MTDATASVLRSPTPTKENVAFTRYGDRAMDPKFSHIFQPPRGEQIQRVDPAELLRVPKTDDHWATVRRSKAYLSELLPPFDIPSGMVEEFSAESIDCERLCEVIPRLNHGQVVELALYLAFEAKLNDKAVWRALEQAAEGALHLMDLR
jgi:hypothetical protein